MKYATALVSLLALPCTSFADGFDYTFVEGGFVNSEIDVGPADIDGDGLGVNGSFAVRDNVRIIAGYMDQDYDFGVDGSLLRFGAGFNTEITPDLDFVADISYVDVEVSAAGISEDETGYELGAGVRGRTSSSIELEAGLTYLDLDDSETGIRVGGRYYFSDSLAAGLWLDDNDTFSRWTLGIRAQFGNR